LIHSCHGIRKFGRYAHRQPEPFEAQNMHAESFRLLIERAFNERDAKMLDSFAQRLAEASEAMSILRNKHYGAHGMGLPAMAKLVPPNQADAEG
jgi:hypothetical protein